MYRIPRLAVILILMIVCAYCADLQKVEGKEKVVCMGDEITKGYWREELIGNGTCWVDILAAYNSDMEVINAGVDGMEAGKVAYLQGILDEYPDADTYIIYFGINDIKRITSIDPGGAASVGAKVLRMVRKIKQSAPKARIVLVAPQRIESAGLSAENKAAGYNANSEVLCDMIAGSIKVVAEREQVEFVSLLDQITPKMLADGVRPNREGHAEIAKIIWNKLKNPGSRSEEDILSVQMAPPPIGVPAVSEQGTEAIIEGINNDIQELAGIGSRVEIVESKQQHIDGRATKFVDKAQTAGIVSKNAYEIGNNLAGVVLDKIEGILIRKVDVVMAAQFADKDLGSDGITQVSYVKYNLPDPSSVASFITNIEAKNNDYELLANAVNWDEVEVERNIDNIKTLSPEEVKNEEKIVTAKPEIDLQKNAEKDIISQKEIIEVWLPELELIEDNTKDRAKVINNLEIAEKEAVALKSTEVKEVFAISEPIEYTGYEVLIHTGIGK